MNKTVLAVIALALLTLALIIMRARLRTSSDESLRQLKQTAVESRQTAATIIAKTKIKEASVRAKARESAALLTDDELCAALTEMLREYRDTAH